MLPEVANFCKEWKLIGRHLKLTGADIAAVDGDNRTVGDKRIGMLSKWKDKWAFKATNRVLIEALLAVGNASCAIAAANIMGRGKYSPCLVTKQQ